MILTALTVMSCGNTWIAKPDPSSFYKQCNPYFQDLSMLFVPGYSETSIIVEDCDFYPIEKVSIALSVFEFEWYKTFGMNEKVSDNLRDLLITFSFEKRFQIELNSQEKLRETTQILGSTSSKNAIWVGVDINDERICDTAFTHELVHASIWAMNGMHGDPDHLGLRYFGWTRQHAALIDKVNSHLCVLGI